MVRKVGEDYVPSKNKKADDGVKEPFFLSRLNILSEEIDIRKVDTYSKHFVVIRFGKDIVWIFIVLLFNNFPTLQLIAVTVYSGLLLICDSVFRPHKVKWHRVIQIVLQALWFSMDLFLLVMRQSQDNFRNDNLTLVMGSFVVFFIVAIISVTLAHGIARIVIRVKRYCHEKRI
jgi:hypothetical protein